MSSAPRTAWRVSVSAPDCVVPPALPGSEVLRIMMATAVECTPTCPVAMGVNCITGKLVIVQTLEYKCTSLDVVPGLQCNCFPLGTQLLSTAPSRLLGVVIVQWYSCVQM